MHLLNNHDAFFPFCPCRLWPLPSFLTRSRLCPGCALGKTKTRCLRSGRREASCTTTSSHVFLLKKYRRGSEVGSWQMTWDW